MSENYSLTQYLLSQHASTFKNATTSPFLRLAASGKLSQDIISDWLANDRLYMQGYIHLSGELLRILQLPQKPVPTKSKDPIQVRLLDWLVDALVNIRREERFFLDVAEKYGVNVDISNAQGVVEEQKKIEGLKRFEKLFGSLTSGQQPHDLLPWLEGVVVFWATEKVYFTAWSWAKSQSQSASTSKPEEDSDGGAMRKEFIPNWTNDEFIEFVDRLEGILDEGVRDAVGSDEGKRKEVEERAGVVWKSLLEAEEAFWPVIDQ